MINRGRPDLGIVSTEPSVHSSGTPPCADRRNKQLRSAREFSVPPMCDGPRVGDAGIAVVTGKPACLGTLGDGALGVALESIGSGKERVVHRMPWAGVARLFVPHDRDRFLISILRAQHIRLREMCKRAAGCRGQSSLGQVFCARDVGHGCSAHAVKDAGCKLVRQPALRRGGVWIERQCAFEQTNRLCVVFDCRRPQPRSASSQNVVQRVRALGRAGRRPRRTRTIRLQADNLVPSGSPSS